VVPRSAVPSGSAFIAVSLLAAGACTYSLAEPRASDGGLDGKDTESPFDAPGTFDATFGPDALDGSPAIVSDAVAGDAGTEIEPEGAALDGPTAANEAATLDGSDDASTDSARLLDPCSNTGGLFYGWYCGGYIGGNPDAVYECSGRHQTITIRACDAGCRVNGNGIPDLCTGEDPCSNVDSHHNGTYCYNSGQNGFNTTVSYEGWLFVCINGSLAGSFNALSTSCCLYGCQVMEAGVPDQCLNGVVCQ
jgi:hypothetical protein